MAAMRRREFRITSVVLAATLLINTGCFVAPFAELQSARMAGPERIELGAHYSSISFARDGESRVIQTHLGAQLAFGLGRTVDGRVRLEHMLVRRDDGDEAFTGVAMGPKFSLIRDRLALNLPFWFTAIEFARISEDALRLGIDDEPVFQVHPTLLHTIPLARGLEVNSSAKALLGSEEVLLAGNVGLGISSDVSRWALRPEIGFLKNPGHGGFAFHMSLGASVFFRTWPR